MVGKPARAVLQTRFLRPLEEIEAALWRDGRWEGELVHTRRDGAAITVASRWAVQRDDQGRPAAVMEISTDVTARKAMEAALREREASSETAQRIAHLGSFDWDFATDVVRWSDEMFRLFDLAPGEVTPSLAAFVEAVHPDDHPTLMQFVQAAYAGTSAPFEFRTSGRGGRGVVRTLHAQTEVVCDPATGQGALIFGTALDITERRRAEAAVNDSNQRLREALTALETTQQQVVEQTRLRALAEMASGIAHDFNNALSPVVAFSDVLLEQLERSDVLTDQAQVRHYVELISRAAADAAGVSRRLRDVYRPDVAVECVSSADLNAVVDQVIALTRPKWKDQALARGATIDVTADLQPVPPVAGDAAELREALTNLVLNAADALPTGGSITIRTRSGQQEGEQDVVLEVADTGMGMSEDVRQRCLEPFYSTKGERGSGLGLPMVDGTARRYGGSLTVSSQPGQGTTVAIRLPARLGPALPPDDPGAADVSPARPLRVLVVDDESPVRAAIVALLTRDGHSITAASSGREALQHVLEHDFDLVVTDRAMPHMNGDRLAAAITGMVPTLPVVVITGFGELMEGAGECPLGVDAVLSKPVTAVNLRAGLRRVLELGVTSPLPAATASPGRG